jgi:predicted ferric reductase
MSQKTDHTRAFKSPPARLVWGTILVLIGIAILAGAASIAFREHHEPSQHQQGAVHGEAEDWREIAGKMCGLLAATLVLLQFPLSAKLKSLDRIFGLHRTLLAHRALGLFAAVLASLHPMLLFAPKDRALGAVRLDISPALVGVVLLIGLWVAVSMGLWRVFLGLRYQAWYRLHRVGMFGAIVLVTLHLLSISDDFHGGWPLYALAAALILYGGLFSWTRVIQPVRLARRRYSVTEVTPAGRDTYAVTSIPENKEIFAYAPGQFAFVTFHSRVLPRERHPWTISSSPTRPEALIFTIKCSGDFTAHIGRLKPGDTAVIDGPYGLFSYLAYDGDPNRELIMVAGGVGVTPMLSMLRYMVDKDAGRKVTLIWSNRAEVDILCRQELEEIETNLSDFTIHHILSEQKDFKGRTGRVTAEMLKELLEGCSRKAALFVCGPPPMMDAVCRDLTRIGFGARQVHTERFSY